MDGAIFMSIPHILHVMDAPLNPYRERIEKAQVLMGEHDIDILLILTLENYRYFTGDVRKQPRMLIPAEGDPVIIVFEGEREEAEEITGIKAMTYRALHEMMGGIIRFFNSIGIEKPRVGVEMDFSVPAFLLERFRMANPDVEVVDSKPVISSLRKIKERHEVELIKKASKLADMAMEIAYDLIKPGISEKEIALEIEYQLRKRGAERIAFPVFVNSGRRTHWLHGTATDKKIEIGDIILIDVGPVYEGYCADITRMFVTGRANGEQKKFYRIYREMQEKVIEMLRPGITVLDIERENERFMKSHGLKEYYVKGFLHGIGLNFEETPFPTIFPEDQMETIERGMTLSAGHSVLSIPGIGGFRVEDTLYIEKRAKKLTSFPNELLEVG